jgi:hypothetical protein
LSTGVDPLLSRCGLVGGSGGHGGQVGVREHREGDVPVPGVVVTGLVARPVAFCRSQRCHGDRNRHRALVELSILVRRDAGCSSFIPAVAGPCDDGPMIYISVVAMDTPREQSADGGYRGPAAGRPPPVDGLAARSVMPALRRGEPGCGKDPGDPLRRIPTGRHWRGPVYSERAV